jgi:hypothetical protein
MNLPNSVLGSICFMFDIESLGEFPLLLSILSLVNWCYYTFFLHYFPTLCVYFRGKGHTLHADFHLFLDSLLDPTLFLLLPQSNGNEKLIS